ncbi:MAG: AraC family transcriptional regulator [Bacteroidaceae bacterium]|nr:AraC family transcriptional regulator [Bacteroidaceae bacterium]
MMYDQIRGDTLYIMLYTVVTTMAMMASCYLLLRRANAIAPDVTSSVRLRRWTGVFFASIALNHVWYMPIFFLSSSEDIIVTDLIGGLLDFMTVFPLAIIVLFVMLQDRRRPLWPVAVMMAPLVVGEVFCLAHRSYAPLPLVYVYSLLICIGLIIYFVRALRQYGRWLRDNYADLEHKEVWQSFLVLAIMLLVFGIYVFISEGPAYQYAMQVIFVVLICFLLWRVETLSELSMPGHDVEVEVQALPHGSSLTFRNDIGPLLKQHCEESQLYLQHDLTLPQLAQDIGMNRVYLSQFFSSQNMTYNAYINGLRIRHFINLYHESAETHQPVTAQQLAYQSGFRSYNTFSVAFKKVMGMTATEWMRKVAEQG